MASGDVEVVVVGAGAAGIAAARRLFDARIDTLLIEARQRIGGRAWTITEASGAALDIGCGWLHSAERNPWCEVAEAQGCSIDKSPPPWARASAAIGMSAADRVAFADALQQFRDRAEALAEESPDQPASNFLDAQCAWNNLINAVSTYYSGVELDRVSARDLQRYDDSGVNWRVMQGYGKAIAEYGAGLPVTLNCKVQKIDHRASPLRIETTEGTIVADAAIVTLPSGVLASQPELFLPALPAKSDAAANLPLGLADKLFFSLRGAEQFESDSRAFGNPARTETAAYHFRPFGRPQIEAYFGGALAAELERGGEAAFHEFAVGELVALLGSDFARRIKPLHIHCWGSDPFSQGSYSFALPGRADSRAALATPVDNCLFFAGEACSPSDYSTAHGAYLTGVAAADQAIAAVRRSARIRV